MVLENFFDIRKRNGHQGATPRTVSVVRWVRVLDIRNSKTGSSNSIASNPQRILPRAILNWPTIHSPDLKIHLPGPNMYPPDLKIHLPGPQYICLTRICIRLARKCNCPYNSDVTCGLTWSARVPCTCPRVYIAALVGVQIIAVGTLNCSGDRLWHLAMFQYLSVTFSKAQYYAAAVWKAQTSAGSA